ncbi:hypothetical protein J1N35_008241 [Gossypium stocksii]|uniref:Uncharacterized protein n=1 Tax=Gossypium stocksii TaxID=47602 RepID=A0A9D3W8X6_9ROSI|nr:hypothetical protein J1N35_008241 [Gossypium stocksii]
MSEFEDTTSILEEEVDSGRLELHLKRRVDHAGTSAMMITASFFTSSQTVIYKSSLVLACGNTSTPSISPLSVPPLMELPLGNSDDLALSHKNLNCEEFEVIALCAKLKKVTEEHKVVVSQINEGNEDATAALKRNQEEASVGFKKNTLQILSNVTIKLKSNILLHTQVVIGPFDVRKVDFDIFVEVEMDQLGFDVLYPSRAALEEFLFKWKNLERFYLERSLELTIVPIDDNTTDTHAANNVDVVEEEEKGEVGRDEDKGREKEVPDDQTKI